MNNEHGNKLEQRVRFVAKRYREGSLDPGLGCDYYRPRTNERCLPSG